MERAFRPASNSLYAGPKMRRSADRIAARGDYLGRTCRIAG
jgi:hypothetical protein